MKILFNSYKNKEKFFTIINKFIYLYKIEIEIIFLFHKFKNINHDFIHCIKTIIIKNTIIEF